MAEEINVPTGEPAGGDKTQPQVTPKGPEENPKSVTLTEAELEKKINSEADRRVNQAITSNREKWEAEHKEALRREREEAQRLALMSVEERQKEMEKRRIEEINRREEALTHKEVQLKAINKLDSQQLPVSFAEFLLGNDEQSTFANIETFEKAWLTAIDAEVTRRLKGKTPTGAKVPQSVDMNALIRGARR